MFSRRVESIKAERLPKIKTIQHINDQEETDCYEEDFPFDMDDSSDEESEEKKQSDVEETSSPDSYFEFRSLGAFSAAVENSRQIIIWCIKLSNHGCVTLLCFQTCVTK